MKTKNLTLNQELFVNCYRNMLFLRKFEEKAAQFYSMGLIGGFCHLYIGQEAVAVGSFAAKSESDSTITSYRDHAHSILSGTNPKALMAELFGQSEGCSKGKGGSMHLFNKNGNFFGGHGIVGAQTSLGTGIAFAEKYKKTENICLIFLGDGAVNQGQLYESFNLASLWKLPALYIIENNQYSMGTSVTRSTSLKELHKKGESFGINGISANGMDVEEVYETVLNMKQLILKEKRPFLIEFKTYRYKGHSMSDPAKYRSREEVDHYREIDPIEKAKTTILEKKLITLDECKDLEKNVKEEIKGVENFVLNEASIPQEDELYKDIYL
ncbi:MAG: pyruvate dehydrogenase (acetyl-transferring) E1 component subunit alpha [Rickettsia sp.]|nr:pyruvate dehydrogenase (acetyl-transferring) E1 component subunit alpha [Rickettsia sp.]